MSDLKYQNYYVRQLFLLVFNTPSVIFTFHFSFKMCEILVINRGQKQIETPNQFQEHFGFLPTRFRAYFEMDLDNCLCQCDLDDTFYEKGIEYMRIDGDYYVGDLQGLDNDFHFEPITPPQ